MGNLCSECGMDEAGRGPVFGPMVIAIVCGDSGKMREIGARDSKSLSPASRERIMALIEREKCFWDYKVLTAADLNERMSRQTLNEIEYDAYLSLIMKSPEGSSIQVDAFDVIEERLQNSLRKDSGRQVTCKHSGDRIFPLVSAASIIAKVIRDRYVREISEKYGDIGSGYPADPKTQEFLRKSIQNGWNIDGIVRKRWKTFVRMKAEYENKRLF